jgi:hypothetical protein
VRFVPDIAEYVASTDATLFFSDETISAGDGRFELILPPHPHGWVQATAASGGSIRTPISRPLERSAMRLGDLILPDRRRLIVRMLDGSACAMSAAGPLDSLGLHIITSEGPGEMRTLDLPEGGEWALAATCGGAGFGVDPRIVRVPPAGSAATVVDAHVVR